MDETTFAIKDDRFERTSADLAELLDSLNNGFRPD